MRRKSRFRGTLLGSLRSPLEDPPRGNLGRLPLPADVAMAPAGSLPSPDTFDPMELWRQPDLRLPDGYLEAVADIDDSTFIGVADYLEHQLSTGRPSWTRRVLCLGLQPEKADQMVRAKRRLDAIDPEDRWPGPPPRVLWSMGRITSSKPWVMYVLTVGLDLYWKGELSEFALWLGIEDAVLRARTPAARDGYVTWFHAFDYRLDLCT